MVPRTPEAMLCPQCIELLLAPHPESVAADVGVPLIIDNVGYPLK